MDIALCFLCGIMTAASIYLMLTGNLIRFIFGLIIASNAVNILIFLAGGISFSDPPLIPEDAVIPEPAMANALPQALILTAIVIGFSLLAFVFILFYRAYQTLGTIEAESMRFAEPDEKGKLPENNAMEGNRA